MSYFTPYKEHYKALIRLGIPIVIGQIGIVVVGLADNMMVGQYATLDPVSYTHLTLPTN